MTPPFESLSSSPAMWSWWTWSLAAQGGGRTPRNTRGRCAIVHELDNVLPQDGDALVAWMRFGASRLPEPDRAQVLKALKASLSTCLSRALGEAKTPWRVGYQALCLPEGRQPVRSNDGPFRCRPAREAAGESTAPSGPRRSCPAFRLAMRSKRPSCCQESGGSSCRRPHSRRIAAGRAAPGPGRMSAPHQCGLVLCHRRR